MAHKESIHGRWSSRWVFILAAVGSAVGLGNIWKFPYLAGENGGGAFVLLYLFCIMVIGVPAMMAEIMLGRRGRQSPINTMHTLAIESGHRPMWQWLGFMGMVAGFIILSYYSVIAGWSIAYLFQSGTGKFSGQTVDGVNAIFDKFINDPEKLLLYHTVFMAMTMFVVMRGVKSGLETAVKFLVPALFILLIVLVGYAMNTSKFVEGLEFLFKPDFSKLTFSVVITAIGQAFFTLSLGMGAIMVYGSYLSKKTSIIKTTFAIAGADTLVAILAGIAIFPIVFENGLDPTGGPGLVFVTMTLAFGKMPAGDFFATLFFTLLTLAAWTSSISILEPVVTYLVENKGFKRATAALITGVFTWLLGIVTVLSFNVWKFSFSFAGDRKDYGMFDILDIIAANIMLPLGVMLIGIFAGWFMSREASRDELDLGDSRIYEVWRFLVRYVTPTAIFLVLLKLLGVLDSITKAVMNMFAF